MDIAWLVGIGVLLLVAGLAALGYDTVRRRHDHQAFPYPDAPTNLLDETAIHALTSKPITATGMREAEVRQPRPPLLERIPRPRIRFARPKIDARQLARTATSPRALLVVGCCALVSTGLAVLAYRVASEPGAPPPGNVVVAVCPFVGAPPKSEPSEYLADELAKTAASSGLTNLLVRRCSLRVATADQAEAERARTKASVLVWGDVGVSGNLTVSLAIAPGLGAGGASWEQWTDREPDALLLPHQMRVLLPASAGINPIVPLLVSTAKLASGDYAGAARAAEGAQATLEQSHGSGEAGAFVRAVAQASEGDFAGAMQGFSRARDDPDIAVESTVNRGFVRLKGGYYTGTRADLDRVIAERDTPDSVLARAHLLRARAFHRLAGDYASALSELDESLRLDPTYYHTKLDRAEALYRLSQPDAAMSELGVLIQKAPDAAPAYRLMGLVWLMLDRPEDAQKSLGQARDIYSRWIAALRAEEGKAQVTGDLEAGKRATDGIVLLNRELSHVYLYQGMALADYARKQPPEGFLAGLWRRIRGEATAYEQAAAAMQEAAKLEPRSPDIPLQMGSVYTAMGDGGKAAEAFHQALALDPDAPGPYLALARLQETQGNAPEAVKTLNDLIGHVPDAYLAYEQLYGIYTRAGDKQSANKTLGRALAVAPRSPQDHLWHGKFLRTLSRNNEAISELQAAAADPAMWESHVLMGHILLEAGRGPDALAQFQAVLATQPNDPDTLLNAGRLLVLAGQTSQAEELFKRLTTTSPNNTDGHISYLQLLLSKGDADVAIAEGKRAVQSDGNRADVYYNLGNAYEARGDWAWASAQYKAATERDQASFDAFLRWAVSLYHEDKYAESIVAADAAIKLRGDDPQPFRWKAESQLAQRAPDDALRSAGRALALSPGSADVLALAARAYLSKGDIVSGTAYAGKAITAEPRNPAGQLAMGEALIAGGHNADALQAFAAAAGIDPRSAEAIVGQGRAYDAMGDRQRALNLYTDALGVDVRYAGAHLYAGHAYVELDRWDEALREYARAAQLRPLWPEALFYLGRAYLQRKDLASAQRYFSSATQYGPNLVEGWFELGIADREMGRTKEAIEALAHATRLNKNYAEAWFYLGLCYEESGDRTSAAQAFANASGATGDPAIKQQAEQGLARLK